MFYRARSDLAVSGVRSRFD